MTPQGLTPQGLTPQGVVLMGTDLLSTESKGVMIENVEIRGTTSASGIRRPTCSPTFRT